LGLVERARQGAENLPASKTLTISEVRDRNRDDSSHHRAGGPAQVPPTLLARADEVIK
jgi:hypothetical protein